MQEPAPSVLGDAIERPSIHTARVGRVARRSQRLPAADTACDRLGAKRRDVRGREAMGISQHSGAQGGWGHIGHMAATVHRQYAEAFTVARHMPALDRSECRSIGRSVGRWTWERVTDEWFSTRQAARGRASGASRRAAAAERNLRIQALADSGMTWAEIRAMTGVSRSTVARALGAAQGLGKGGCHEPDQDVSALGGSGVSGWT